VNTEFKTATSWMCKHVRFDCVSRAMGAAYSFKDYRHMEQLRQQIWDRVPCNMLLAALRLGEVETENMGKGHLNRRQRLAQFERPVSDAFLFLPPLGPGSLTFDNSLGLSESLPPTCHP
jgi:hypothetical protein